MITSLLLRLKALVGFNPIAWIGHTRRMRRQIAAYFGVTSTAATGPAVLVVIAPWQGSGIPWFSLAIGLMLGTRGGHMTFVVDGQPFGDNVFRHKFVLRCIGAVMPLVAQRHRVIALAEQAPQAEGDTDAALIAQLAGWNATWTLRGEMADAGRAAFEAQARAQLARANGRIAALLAAEPFDLLFVPGGIYGTSGLWVGHARRLGIRIASYDNASYGTGMFAVDGVACHLDDIPRAFWAIRGRCDADAAERSAVMAEANHEIDQRRSGTDAFGSQIADTGGGDLTSRIAGGVLIALNSSWDSAALGRHQVFADSSAWIVATVRYLLETSTVPVIVRQHPAERLAFAHTSDDYRHLLDQHFGAHPRLHFIAAADPINSYALLAEVGSVVVHTSTIGTEATVFGRPVITASKPYFAALGFVWAAADLAHYHALLDDAAAGRLVVTATMRDDARLCFYTTQICNWVKSVFNPEDFKQWSRIDFTRLQADPPIVRLLDAMVSNTPVALLNHVARAAGRARAGD
ncbi:MAG: hypothetical protein H7267_08660 [Sandarakinorhabdus sp.]|nr:hypothetical protein [Sandarakinorhabdus sp.]